MCVLGKRLLKDIAVDNCTKEAGGPLYNIFCEDGGECDPYFKGKSDPPGTSLPGAVGLVAVKLN